MENKPSSSPSYSDVPLSSLLLFPVGIEEVRVPGRSKGKCNNLDLTSVYQYFRYL